MEYVSSDMAVACRKCGRPFESNANFCTSCGATIQVEPSGDAARYVGITVDGFRLEVPIGVGSMGVVYQATQLSLGKQVAVKVLRQAFITDSVVAERFRREALAASRLKHPNTINVLHFGLLPDGAPFIAMELLQGRDLSEVVNEGFPLGTRRTVTLLSQVCQALSEAHAMGIIHRDLKPANILVVDRRSEEVIKVLDFGIAKLQDTEGQGLTRDGLVCGTPAFMSPEQVSGGTVDARSDLFSLGIILYFMLTGQLPFRGATAVDMASAILMDRPKPPSRVRLDALVAPGLEQVCMRALEKHAADRYASVDEFRLALEDALALFEAEGGDEQLKRRVVAPVQARVGAVVQGLNVATTVNQAALGVPQPTRQRRPRWIIPLVAGVGIGLLAAIGLVVMSLGSGAESATTTDAGSSVTPTVPPFPVQPLATGAAGGAAVAAAVGALWPLPAAEVPLADDAELIFDGEDLDDVAEEVVEDDRDAKRRERREKAAEQFAQAEKIWRSDTTGAIKLLESSAKLNRGSWRTWELLGDAYLRLPDRVEAAKAYQKVLKFNPTHPRRRILEKKIEAAGLTP